MKVMLLAAGLGARLRPYTNEVPKPAIPFLTVPLAGFTISLIDRLKIEKIVVNTHHLPQKVENAFRWMKLPTKNIIFNFEESLLGSAGGINNAKSYLEGKTPILVMNADEVILPHKMGVIEDMLAFHRSHKGLATLLTMNHKDVGTKFGGAWTDSASGSTQIMKFSKTPVTNMTGHHFIGAMILDSRVFKYMSPVVQEENILYETLTTAMAAGEQVHAFEIACEWFETGNPQDFIKATEACVTALDTTPETYWVDYLAQTVRVYGEGKVLIEKESPQLVEKMRTVFKKSLIRIDD